MVMIGAAGADLKGVARFFFVPGGRGVQGTEHRERMC